MRLHCVPKLQAAAVVRQRVRMHNDAHIIPARQPESEQVLADPHSIPVTVCTSVFEVHMVEPEPQQIRRDRHIDSTDVPVPSGIFCALETYARLPACEASTPRYRS